MELTLKREPSTPRSTPGKLYVGDAFDSFTLEDVMRERKVHGETAIPAGRYLVILNWSDRFRRMLPLVVNVPGFEGIRIHPGNTAKDTEGCILVGKSRGKDSVTNSRAAFDALYKKIYEANKHEKIYLTVANPA